MTRIKKKTRAGRRRRSPPPYVKPTRLGKSNEVHNCVSEMRKRLLPFKGSALLLNGKLEMLIKAFIGTAWEAKSRTRVFVMDKRFKSTRSRRKFGGIDFLAFDRSKSQFWIETKCSFFEDPRDGERCARSALRQADETIGHLRDELAETDVYIVHFVNASPFRMRHLFPKFVIDKFPVGSKVNSNLVRDAWNRVAADCRKEHIEYLEQIYASHRGKRWYQSSAIIPIANDPMVDAIVVKLMPAAQAAVGIL